MKPSNIRGKYSDDLVRQKRARFLFKITLAAVLVLMAIAGIFYLLFLHNLMDIRVVTIEGLNTINSDELKNKIMEQLEGKYLGFVPQKNNLYFLNTDNLKSEILSRYLILSDLGIEKNMPHELVFKFKERAAVGIWCFYDNNCLYFDSEGNTWGPAIKSSGFLIVIVEDNRKLEKTEIDNEYFKAIKSLTNNDKLPFTIKNIIISEDSFRGLKINTAEGYYVLMSLDSNISEQIEVLRIFINEKRKGDFNPKYLDIRVDGRVYYKKL